MNEKGFNDGLHDKNKFKEENNLLDKKVLYQDEKILDRQKGYQLLVHLGHKVKNAHIGHFTIIDKDVEHGMNFKIGCHSVVESDCVFGHSVTIGHRVVIKSGAIIGNNVQIADGVCITGACRIGNNVDIRTGAIISKGNIIEDKVFIGPGVVTNHTKNIRGSKKKQLITYIGYGTILGSQASILAGVNIAPNVIVGAAAVVTKSLHHSGVYLGNPAVKIFESPQDVKIQTLEDYYPLYVSESLYNQFKKYMPDLVPDGYLDQTESKIED